MKSRLATLLVGGLLSTGAFAEVPEFDVAAEINTQFSQAGCSSRPYYQYRDVCRRQLVSRAGTTCVQKGFSGQNQMVPKTFQFGGQQGGKPCPPGPYAYYRFTCSARFYCY